MLIISRPFVTVTTSASRKILLRNHNIFYISSVIAVRMYVYIFYYCI